MRNPLAILADDAEGGIVIHEGRLIEKIASGQQPREPVDAVFDASNHVIIPGLINTHHHFFQTLTRAFPPALNKTLFPWLGTMLPIWQHLESDMIRAAARLAMAELLLSGCTTAADHHYLFTPTLQDAIDIEAETAADLGMRVVLTRGSIDFYDGEHGLTPKSIVEPMQHILDHTEALIKRYHQIGHGSMIQIAVAPCSPFEVTTELMQSSAHLARQYQTPLHTHLAETNDEVVFCQTTYGCRPVRFLEDIGWLQSDVWLAHGIHLTDDEINRLGSARIGISHCPSSNALLASGCCPVPRLEQAGCRVGLGVDGSASNDASNLMQEVRQAFLTQRSAHGIGAITHLDALRWATEGSAACLNRNDIGCIAPGKCADLALFRLDQEPRFSGYGDPLAALVLCGAHRADRVMVNGRWVVEDGKLVHADLGDIIANHTRAARTIQSIV